MEDGETLTKPLTVQLQNKVQLYERLQYIFS
jgi:hypothetical protein